MGFVQNSSLLLTSVLRHHPSDDTDFDKMMQDGALRQDFRFRGFPNHSMHSPRQPITSTVSEDKKRNEENFVKVFGKSSIFDPAHHEHWKPAQAKPRIDEGHAGLQYGTDQIDNSPRVRGKNDPFMEKSNAEISKLYNMRREAQDDILRFKQEKMMHNFQLEEEKKRDLEIQDKYYPWDRLGRGGGAPRVIPDHSFH